ncbi:MAG TPA: hypothetical protein VMH36_26620 [Alphaproteobacteria bacterium]|nr:hypothetical protein [Alphaproteobacteria bacterium]
MNTSAVQDSAAAGWFRALAWFLSLVLFALVLRPAAHVFDMPMTEDGYYALSVARNLAAGHGLTIDGEHLTNGFQPLFTILEAGAFRLAGTDQVLALRLVMALAWLFHVGGALVIAMVARDAWPSRFGGRERELRAPIAAFLYLAAPLLLNHAYNGLETGCTMFFYALAARWMQTGRDRSWGGLAGFGAIIGCLVLARIDAGAVAAVLGLNELRRARHGGLLHLVGRAAVLGVTAFLISSPWWLYNTIYFGSPMPTSGAAQQAWGLEWLRFEDAEWALRVVLVPWLFVGAHEANLSLNAPLPFGPDGYITMTATGFVRTIVVLAVALALVRAGRRGVIGRDLAAASAYEAATTRRTLEFAACFGFGFVALLVYYIGGFSAHWFYYRYFAPLALVSFVIVPILLARAWYGIERPRLAMALALLLALQMAGWTGFALAGRGLGGNTVYVDQVQLVREHVPAADYVAAGQSGTLGFFRDHVINTDGKVNRDAIAYQDDMWDYLRANHVRWFADWPFYVNKYLGVPFDPTGDKPVTEANGWRFVAERNYFYLYEYVGPPAR